MKPVDLKKYACAVPFSQLEMGEHSRLLCCGSWLKKLLPEDVSAKEAWNSKEANDIRRSVLDGSFKYCDKTQCPFLSRVIAGESVSRTTRAVHLKSQLPPEAKSQIDKFLNGEEINPTVIQFSFDRTCNLQCPSCRVALIVENGKGIRRVNAEIDKIQEQYGKTTKRLYITGSGDPFISVGFRNFLRNFDKTKWPSLNRIHLHTNSTKWNKKMWDSMSPIHPYVKTCEISIDAATKDTYENKTRIGGNWESLLDNLRFISTIDRLQLIKTSFVVQNKNYSEMKMFYELMYSIFGNKVNVYFNKITNWGTFTDDEFLKHKVWDSNHPNYNDFVREVNSFLPVKNCWHNLHEFIKPSTRLI